MFEIYFMLDFYGAFHEIRRCFQPKARFFMCYICFATINVVVNMQHNNKLNLIFAVVLYLSIVLILFTGNLWFRIVCCAIVIFIGGGSEIILWFLMQFSADVSTNQALENEFFMVITMFTSELVYFIFLSNFFIFFLFFYFYNIFSICRIIIILSCITGYIIWVL